MIFRIRDIKIKRVRIFGLMFLLFITVLFIGAATRVVIRKIQERYESKASNQIIEELRSELSGIKNPQEVLDIMEKVLGDPDRDIGSGLYVPQWELSDGTVVTFHPIEGPSFKDQDNNTAWLLETENKAHKNILGEYDVYTGADYRYAGIYLIGSLNLDSDGTYEFVEHDVTIVPLELMDKQKDNFFMNNPNGSYTLDYQDGFTGDTLLEEVEDHSTLVQVDFVANDSQETEVFLIRVNKVQRNLYFHSTVSEIELFRVEKRWNNLF